MLGGSRIRRYDFRGSIRDGENSVATYLKHGMEQADLDEADAEVRNLVEGILDDIRGRGDAAVGGPTVEICRPFEGSGHSDPVLVEHPQRGHGLDLACIDRDLQLLCKYLKVRRAIRQRSGGGGRCSWWWVRPFL